MNNKYIYIFITIIFINFVCLNEITAEQLSKIDEIVDEINKAPDFTLNAIHIDKDTTFTLSEMKDKVILINFWATWCGPCRMEIPDFNELYERYHKDGFEILSISISDNKKAIEKFMEVYKMNYPVLYGNQIEMQEITYNYGGVYSIPTSVIVGINNEILRIYPGAILKQYDPNMYADLIYNIEKGINDLKGINDIKNEIFK